MFYHPDKSWNKDELLNQENLIPNVIPPWKVIPESLCSWISYLVQGESN